MKPRPLQPPPVAAGPLGEPRAAFMARIRASLAPSSPPAEPTPLPALNDSLLRLSAANADQVSRFCARAQATGMRARRTTSAEAASTLAEVLKTHAVISAVVNSPASTPQTLILVQAASLAAVQIRDRQTAPGVAASFTVDAGLTDVAAAIAETGTLVVSSSSRGRGAFIVPPLHVAIVFASQIVPDMLDLWPVLAEDGELDAAAITLITGPSKTADIEGVLVTGVHGPGEVEIIVVDDA